MPHVAELIAVGTELLLGSIANTDGQFLSRELSAPVVLEGHAALGEPGLLVVVGGDLPPGAAEVVLHQRCFAPVV